jgi:hypothetical protein
MVQISTCSAIALNFPETTESAHFDKISFRIKNKIFATFSEVSKIATLKLTLADQSIFCNLDPSVFYPVPNAWGKQGWTHMDLKKVKKQVMTGAMTAAYCAVAPKTLSAKYTDNPTDKFQ